MVKLPDTITACLFDLDGVLTATAKVHMKAWKQTFDDELRRREGDGVRLFDQQDYNDYVDGKPRYDGVRSFMGSRGHQLDEDDVRAIGDRKNALVLELIAAGGVDVYPGSVTFLKAVREAGLRTAVVSSSANCASVVEAGGIAGLLDARVDGATIVAEHLEGKPAPDSFLAGAQRLGVSAAQACVFEDATAGVAAGRAGSFGYVVGVNRLGADHARDLAADGADIVVADLSELL